jgi:DNA-binding NarL/FixJ family response regulator
MMVKLSLREVEIVKRLALSNKEIAQEFGITESTVKQRVKTILLRFNVNGRAQVLIMAIKLGIINLEDVVL